MCMNLYLPLFTINLAYKFMYLNKFYLLNR